MVQLVVVNIARSEEEAETQFETGQVVTGLDDVEDEADLETEELFEEEAAETAAAEIEEAAEELQAAEAEEAVEEAAEDASAEETAETEEEDKA